MMSKISVPKWFPILWAIGGAIVAGAVNVGAQTAKYEAIMQKVEAQPAVNAEQAARIAEISQQLQILKAEFGGLKASIEDVKQDTKAIRDVLLRRN